MHVGTTYFMYSNVKFSDLEFASEYSISEFLELCAFIFVVYVLITRIIGVLFTVLVPYDVPHWPPIPIFCCRVIHGDDCPAFCDLLFGL